jgi:hypothetical protein
MRSRPTAGTLASWSEWEIWRERNPGNNGPNGFGFAPGDDTTDQAATETGTTSKTPTTAETKETTTTKAAEQGTATHTRCELTQQLQHHTGGPFNILNPVGGSRSLTPHPPHTPQHTITTCKPCNTPPQDGSDSDSDYSDSSHNDEADHDEERAARKIRLFLSEIPTPAWQDIVMDRAAWTKMLRSTYTN